MIGKDNKGRFIKGRIESAQEKEKRSLSLKQSWKSRENFHGYYGTKIHNTWRSMKNRCDGKSSIDCNKKYNQKGIAYCEEWKHFKNFLRDMQSTYFEGAQLDRINNSLGYSKENCRWVTSKENANNKTNNIKIEYLNQVKTLSQWADYFGIKFSTIRNRYYKYYLKGHYGIEKLFKNK